MPLTRRNLFQRDNHTCQYCGSREQLSIDHVMPRSRGGQDIWENVTTACLPVAMFARAVEPLRRQSMPLHHRAPGAH